MNCSSCGAPAIHQHHAIYVQELRRLARKLGTPYTVLIADERNLVPLCLECHSAHHNRVAPLHLKTLPNSVYDFARWALDAGPAFEYLTRRYIGQDSRLDALLAEWEAEAA